MMKQAVREYLESALATVGADDVVFQAWAMGKSPIVDKASSCSGVLFENERALTVRTHNALVAAEGLAFAFPDMIDPECFEFGIIHGVPASQLIAFQDRLDRWTHAWMTGPADRCDYPSEFLEHVLAVSLEADRSGPRPQRLPLKKWIRN